MGYLTFEEYVEKGGTLDNAAFSKCIMFAEKKLDSMTPTVPHPLIATDAVKQAVVYLIDNYASQRFATATKTQQVASFSNDGVSVTLKTTTVNDEEKELYSVIHMLLPHETRLGVLMRC